MTSFRSATSFLLLSVPIFVMTLATTCLGKQKSDSAIDVLAQEDSKLAQSRTERSGIEPGGTELSEIEPWGYDGSILLIGSSESMFADPVVDEFKRRIPKTHLAVVVLHSAECDAKVLEQFSMQWDGDSSIKFFALSDLSQSQTGAGNSQGGEFLEAIRAAGGVWFMQASRPELIELSKNKALRNELHELLERRGAVAACGESCGLLGQVAGVSGAEAKEGDVAELVGFGLVPQARIEGSADRRAGRPRAQEENAVHQDQERAGSQRTEEAAGSQRTEQKTDRPHTEEAAHKGNEVVLSIESGTMVILRNRTLRVIGAGQVGTGDIGAGEIGAGEVTVSLGPADYRPAETLRLKNNDFADWTQLCRAARDRAKNVDPGKPNGIASIQSGALVIVGGGSMPRSVVNKFMELASGSTAKIVYLPTAVPPSEQRETYPPPFFAGAEKVTVLNQRGATEVDSDEFREALNEATAVWFGGGRQWNFVDAYEGTQAIELFQAVLQRGGVIGGSSAGATIQGEFLVRGHPLGNTVMMAEGYERGFSFLPGSAIDQHFAQRNRFADLEAVIKKHQDLLGVGIDEGTALVVQPHTSEVIGNGSVYLLRSQQLTGDDIQATSKSRFIEVRSGSKVDLISLEVTP